MREQEPDVMVNVTGNVPGKLKAAEGLKIAEVPLPGPKFHCALVPKVELFVNVIILVALKQLKTGGDGLVETLIDKF